MEWRILVVERGFVSRCRGTRGVVAGLEDICWYGVGVGGWRYGIWIMGDGVLAWFGWGSGSLVEYGGWNEMSRWLSMDFSGGMDPKLKETRYFL